MAGVSPTFASWLEDPDNATLAKHEMEPLSQVDRGARLLTPDKEDGGFFSDVGTATATGMADLGKSAGLLAAAFGITDPRNAAHFIADMAQRSTALASQAPDYRKDYLAAMEQHSGNVNTAWQAYLDSSVGTERGAVRKALDALLTGGATLGEALSLIGAAATRPRGLGYGLVESLAAMTPIVGGAMAGGAGGAALGTVVPVVGTAVGGVVGSMAGTFAGAAPLNVGAEVAAEMQKRGVDLTDPVAVERALGDAKLMQMVRDKAIAGGVTSAAVMSLFAGFSGTLANAPIKAAEKAVMAEVAKGTLTAAEAQAKLELARATAKATMGSASKVVRHTGDAGVQAVGVAAGGEAGAAAKGEPIEPGRALTTTLEMLGFGVATEVAGASRRAAFSKEPTLAAREATVKAQQALRAAHDAQALSEIGSAAKAAETVGKLPDRLRSLVETATGGRDAGTVYFQSAEWDAYWQSQGASPAKAAADILGDNGKAYHDALTTGASIAVPLADYIAHVAPTPHWEGLLESARMQPDGMSLREAHTYLQSLPDTMREIATEAKATPEEGTPAAAARKVAEDVETQLRATGVGEATAKAQAAVYESAFRTLGERTGQDPLDLYRRYGLRIARSEEPGVADLSKGPQALKEGEALIEHTPLEGEPALLRSLKVGTDQKSDVRTLKNEELPAAIMHLEKRLRTVEEAAATEGGDAAQERGQAVRDDLATIQAEVARRGAGGTEMKLPFRVVDSEGRTRGRYHTLEEAQAAMKEKGLTAPGMIGTEAHAAPLESAAMESAASAVAADRTLNQTSVPQTNEEIGRTVAIAAVETLARSQQSLEAGKIRQAQLDQPKGAPDLAPAMMRKGRLFEQANEGGARGRITFGPERTFNIDLLAKADRSTFLHETGHFYLEVLGDLAARPDAAPDVVADHAIVRQWLGAEEGKPLSVEQHEQFARGFEAYLMEGKAPSERLRGAFYRFKNWLVGIYQNLTNLNVDLTPEVRGVFDRLLATREEIAAEEARQQAQPLFADPRVVGMSEDQAQKYEAAVSAAHEAAEESLSTKMMKDVLREQSAEWEAWRAPILKAITDEINSRPEYKALAYLQKYQNPDGTPLPEGTPQLKLNRQSIVDTYGSEFAARLPRGVMASTEKGGTNTSVIAEMFGFRSGRALVEALAATGPKKSLIEYMTDERMRQEHGERPTAPEIQEAAKEAVRGGEKRAQLLRLELEQLASEQLPKLKGMIRAVTRAVPPDAEVKGQANRIIGDTSVRDLRPDLYGAAADRHGRDAREALFKGDVEAAFEAKRKQVLATAVYDAAVRAKESVADALEEFKPMFRSDERLSDLRDMDLVNAARAVLASFGIGKTDRPASSYLEQLRKYDPEMYETVNAMVTEATTGAADYKTISYADFAEMRDSVAAMWDLSRRTRQLEIDGKKVDRQVVEQELMERLDEITTTGKKPGYERAATNWDKVKMGLMGVRASLRRVESWVDAADDLQPAGLFRRYLWNPISEGVSQYRMAKKGILEQYLTIVKGIEETLTQDAINAPELGYEFKNKGEVLGAMLHTGNESNLSKLLRGRKWGDVGEDGQLDTGRWDGFVRRLQREGGLTKADYDYLQATWDLFEQLKAGAQKAHREMYGRYFSEITHDPFSTPYGEYQGGYYPAKADPFMVPDAAIRGEQESVLGSDNSFMFPTTGRGFTKARVEAYAKPLIIDAAFVPSALDAVLRFTHIEPRVRDVARVVMSRDFRPVLDNFDPTVGGDMLVPWLQRSAQQRIDTPTKGWGGKFFDGAMREMRTRTGLSIMTANVVNALQQITGLATSMIKVEPRHMAGALWRYVRAPAEMTRMVSEKSDFMATRETAQVMEIQKSIDHLMLNPTKYEELRAFAKEHGYFLSSGAQNIVDTTTWMAKYDEATTRGVSEREAVREADAAVRLTQGSFAPEDVSRFETGSPFQRAFTQFYAYFNAMANLQGTEFASVARNAGLRKGAGRLLYVYFLGIAMPAALSEVLTRAASGNPLDEDDDGPVDDILSMFFGSQAKFLAAMVPGIGPAISYGVGKFTGAAFNDHISMSPAISTVESVSRVPFDVYKMIHDKQVRTQDIRDVLTAISLTTGVPLTFLAKPAGYLHDVQTGKAQPTGPIDFTRGLITGRPGKP